MGLISKIKSSWGTPVDSNVIYPSNENLIGLIEEQQATATTAPNGESELQKSMNGKDLSYAQPLMRLGDFDVVDGQKYLGHDAGSFAVTHDLLREQSFNPLIHAIISTRANQASKFAIPANYSADGVGFEIVKKGNTDASQLNATDKQRVKILEEFILNLGTAETNGIPSTNLKFRDWVKKTVRDVLVFDQANSELVYDKAGNLQYFHAVDAGTIYHSANSDGKVQNDSKGTKFVQVVDTTKAVPYTIDEMTFDVMNPRTDLKAYQYGTSPLEVALPELDSFIRSEQFNSRYFSQGGTTSGILNIKPSSQTSAGALEDFRREWSAGFSGIAGAWRIPVITADDVKFLNMNQSSKDMEFEKWTTYLVNLITAVFGIDPQEINFQNNASGSHLQEASRKEGAELSQDKGLMPLLQFLADVINNNILSRKYNGDFILRFRGDSTSKEMQELGKVKAQVESIYTLNEVRAQYNLPPLENGNSPLNAIAVQVQGQINQVKQLEQERKDAMRQAKAEKSEATQTPTVTVQDLQEGMTGKQSTKDPQTKKDGQIRAKQTANQNKQAGSKRNK